MHDLIIMGGGPGGYVAAERAGAAGLKTLLIEREHLGGVCLNKGCIPTKTLLNAAKTYAHAKEGAKYGVNAEGLSFDMAKAQAWKGETVSKLKAGVEFLMKKNGVEVISGTAELVAPGKVRVRETGAEYEASNVIVATGSEPAMPPIPGARDNPRVIDSTLALALDAVPATFAVIGGGVIGLEFASLFSSLGSKVTVIEMLDEILPFMDSETAVTMRRAMRTITFELGAKVTAIEGGTVRYEKGGEAKSVEADVILMAVGRKPVVAGIGLEAAGVEFTAKGIAIDDSARTNVKGVYAIGDCTGRSLLAHSASRMGEVAVDAILGKESKMAWDSIPWAVYSLPEAGGAGLTEKRALELGLSVKKVSVPLRLSGRFCAENGFTAQGSCKVIAEAGTGRLLGVHVAGTYASEFIWGVTPLLDRGITVDELKATVFPHPTVAEIVREACWELSH